MNRSFTTRLLSSKLLPGKTEFRKLLSLITLVAFIARLIVVLNSSPMNMKYDEVDYYLLGKNLYEGKGFVAHEQTQAQFQGGKPGEPTAYRSVILPAFLAAHFFVFGENELPPRISLIILSALSCILIGLIGRMLYAPKVGLIAALIWAFYPPCLFGWYSSDRFLTEGIGIFLLLGSFYFLVRLFRNYTFRDCVGAGVLFGLAVLTRGFLAITLPLLVGYLFFFATEKRFKSAFFFGLFASIIIGSWVARNYMVMGKPVLSTQTDSFFWGHNDFSRGSVHGDVFNVEPWTAAQVQPLLQKYPGIRDYSEIQLSEVWSKEGMQWAKANPKRELWLCYKKTLGYILPYQLYTAGFYKWHYVYFILFIGAIMALLFTRNKKEYFLLAMPYIGVWIATLMTITIDRYRLTIEPFIVIAGTFGIIELINRVKRKSLQ